MIKKILLAGLFFGGASLTASAQTASEQPAPYIEQEGSEVTATAPAVEAVLPSQQPVSAQRAVTEKQGATTQSVPLLPSSLPSETVSAQRSSSVSNMATKEKAETSSATPKDVE